MPQSHAVGVSRIAAVVCKFVSVQLYRDKVVADGNADGKLTILVGMYNFAVLGTDNTIDGEVGSFHRIVGACVEDLTADGE